MKKLRWRFGFWLLKVALDVMPQGEAVQRLALTIYVWLHAEDVIFHKVTPAAQPPKIDPEMLKPRTLH